MIAGLVSGLGRSLREFVVGVGFAGRMFASMLGSSLGLLRRPRLITDQNQMANLGYWVREGYTGRGIAAVAARAAAVFAFAHTGLTRLEIVAQAGNLRSQRVAEKTGATLECLARNRLVFHGEPRDAKVFSLIPADLGRSVPVHC